MEAMVSKPLCQRIRQICGDNYGVSGSL